MVWLTRRFITIRRIPSSIVHRESRVTTPSWPHEKRFLVCKHFHRKYAGRDINGKGKNVRQRVLCLPHKRQGALPFPVEYRRRRFGAAVGKMPRKVTRCENSNAGVFHIAIARANIRVSLTKFSVRGTIRKLILRKHTRERSKRKMCISRVWYIYYILR